jgi:hypothetical protein
MKSRIRVRMLKEEDLFALSDLEGCGVPFLPVQKGGV